ncbi:radical SAM protein [Ruminococcus sp. NK3A76]|uniref:elongator complex protein 3 n=1 Tax=Ruminococcus sp. NK3A76 TaxID=877411 RepID=UPI00048C8D7B|nr:radical SAM protein [Ruminococcus sp. NK3A76]
MKHSNISIFVPHIGCPHLCAFCDQRTISGEDKAPKPDDVRRICAQALDEISSPENTEIAFFGGSFTAIRHDYMTALLEAANEFVGEGKFRGIRLSTRPDYIDDDVLGVLKKYNVTAIELGAQSLDDEVLAANERGHTAQDVVDASELIRRYGFELGLQMMVGLYKSTREKELATMRKIIDIRPQTVRIYPVVILKGTKLGSLYQSGEYQTMSFDDVVELCADMLTEFDNADIKVIKCGLHASEFVERDMLGGFYHPAFRELCEAVCYRKAFDAEINKTGLSKGIAEFAVPSKNLSKALGQKKSNVGYFADKGFELRLVPSDDTNDKYQVINIWQ